MLPFSGLPGIPPNLKSCHPNCRRQFLRRGAALEVQANRSAGGHTISGAIGWEGTTVVNRVVLRGHLARGNFNPARSPGDLESQLE